MKNDFLWAVMSYIIHETAICLNPSTGEAGNLGRFLIDQQLSMLRFYENKKRSSFLVDTTF
jgi:hypothetical protein